MAAPRKTAKTKPAPVAAPAVEKQKHKPTAEQENCIEQFLSGEPLRINAYAGAGKTSTLVLCAAATHRPGTYVAFNRSIADDAASKFPTHVSCSTLHSLAMRALAPRYMKALDGKKLTGSMNGGYLAAKMGLGTEQLNAHTLIPPRAWGRLLLDAIRRFCMSGRPELSTSDVYFEGALKNLEFPEQQHLKQRIVMDARRVWERMVDARGDLPLGHDGYLKLWALQKPQLAGDYVFADEAQDTNGVVLELLRNQRRQIVAVGDHFQQIYEWRGAINAMEALPANREARLTQSFRFGPAVASFASEILDLLGERIPVRGNASLPTKLCRIDNPEIILCRTNATLLERLMRALDDGLQPHIVGGVTQMLSWLDATESLMAGRPVDYPMEFFGFKNWDEVLTACENAEAGELTVWVQIINRYKPPVLRRCLQGLPRTEEEADLLLSTGHKAKGREWDKVELAGDFLRSVMKSEIGPESIAAELRLFYVASTRAKLELDVPETCFTALSLLRERREKSASGATEAA